MFLGAETSRYFNIEKHGEFEFRLLVSFSPDVFGITGRLQRNLRLGSARDLITAGLAEL